MTGKRYGDGADVGDVLVSSWGYDQTNVDFYKVVRRTKASVWLVKIGQHYVEGSGGFMSESVTPDPSNVLPWSGYEPAWKAGDGGGCEPRVKRVKTPEWNGGRAIVRMTSYSSATAYEGRPMYQSHYA